MGRGIRRGNLKSRNNMNKVMMAEKSPVHIQNEKKQTDMYTNSKTLPSDLVSITNRRE